MMTKNCGNCKHYEQIEKSRTGHCRKKNCANFGKVRNYRRPAAERCYEPRIITNAGRIRAMTDKELATIFADYIDCSQCPRQNPNGCDGDCYSGALKWLKQEVQEDAEND